MAGPLSGRSGWTLTEGHAGMAGQARALADALGLVVTEKTVVPPPWAWLPPGLTPAPLSFARRRGDPLDPPYPELLISCGRRSVAPALALAKDSRGRGRRIFTIHIGDPRVAPARFDIVVAPAHDRLAGDNVIATMGSLHAFTPALLATAAAETRARYEPLPRPLVAVLVGGPSRAYSMGAAEMARLGADLKALAAGTGCGLAITPSRRTGAANLATLTRALGPVAADIWDGTGPNPYPGLLGLADAVVVTCDSVNMVSEATASGKPVYVAMFEGRSARFEAFHEEMAARGHTRPFAGRFEDWKPVPLIETAKVAAAIAERFEPSQGSAG